MEKQKHSNHEKGQNNRKSQLDGNQGLRVNT